MIRKYKLVIFDFCLNITATALPILVTQFLLYPVLSKQISNTMFGIILTIIALRNSISLIIGGSLDNVRLLRESEKPKEGRNCDYNFLLFISQLVDVAVIIFLIIVYGNTFQKVDFIFLFLILIISTVRVYGSVFYRINLEFRKIVKLSILNSVGLLIGLAVYILFIKSWSLIFLVSEIFSLIYILKTTPVTKEKTNLSAEFKLIVNDYFNLLFSKVITNGMTYLDRFLINPVLGAEKVTIFYVATVISKMISIVVAPLNSVILSYAAKYKSKMSKALFLKYFLGIIVVSFLEYAFLQIISPFAIKLLYPQLYALVKQYIGLASIGIIIGVACNLIHPLVLITSDIKWQTKINTIYVMVYLPLALLLTRRFDLIGFCYATIIANFIRLVILFYVGFTKDNLKN